MKTIYLFVVTMTVLCFTACTSVDNDLIEGSSLYESIKTAYGIEEVASGMSDMEQIPAVSLEEMKSILEALRANSNKKANCTVEQTNDANFGGTNELNKKVIMGSEYAARNASSKVIEKFLLRVELKFSIDKNQVFYYGTDYLYDSQLFDWRANGLSIAPVRNKEYTYAFESESHLYFKVRERGNEVVKVGLLFEGEYNFKAESGHYRFQLDKCPK